MRLYRANQLFGPTGITGLGRSSFYSAVKTGHFPQPVQISARAVAWQSSDVEAWLTSRPPRGKLA